MKRVENAMADQNRGSERTTSGNRIRENRTAVAVVGTALAVVVTGWLLDRLGVFDLTDLQPPGLEDFPLFVVFGGLVVVIVAWSLWRLGSILELR
ncbi:hypothetical protein [Natronosalvus halobius]|uniref:hypothetical protein n=1 Tax=Natronosalvus halobius TaxID=2953746 RepID=UPI00209FF2F4|nr:hypothetical protein [Natronosalvus halobius]USZ70761.1 hypothetical protein NGM15_11690 [Natronosalvus halobius]